MMDRTLPTDLVPDGGVPYRPAIPIFMYHQVTPRPLPAFRKYAVTTADFAAQMECLALAGYVPIGMNTLLDHRAGRGSLPSRPVILTFDDGYRDCLEHAVPVLKARGFTAIFYIVVGLVGRTSRWLLAERGIELPMMDWAAVRELKASGFDCGSHSMNHVRLADLRSADCRAELLDSRRLLEDQLGQEIRHLAYPFGSYDERVRTIAEEAGYSSACSVRIGYSPPDDDPLALHRLPVNGQDGLNAFGRRLRWPPAECPSGDSGALGGEREKRSDEGMRSSPRVSIVIPTYQRRDSIERELRALARQAFSPENYEVIVSIDGSEDGTREMVEHFKAPFGVRAVWQPKLGRAAACNAGILAARGELLVLLDDDMEPSPELLAAHARAHPDGSRLGVLGAAPVVVDGASPPVVQFIASRFRRHLEQLARPDYQIGIGDVYTGNFSMHRDTFLEVGLFDEGFDSYGDENGELALRLLKAGVRLVYSPEALALQHYEKDFAALAQDNVAKGRTAVLCLSQYPDTFQRLKLSQHRSGSRKWRLLRALLLELSRVFAQTPDWVIRLMTYLEKRQPARLHFYYSLALDYFFWVGARPALSKRSGADRKLMARAESLVPGHGAT